MPSYSFHCDDCDHAFDVNASMKTPPKKPRCPKCGQKGPWRVYNPRVVASPANWPRCSDALGVAAHQVEEAHKKSVELGVPTDFTPDGRAIMTSRGHEKKYCKAFGMYHRNAGYGDQAPVNMGKGDAKRPKVPLFDFDGS